MQGVRGFSGQRWDPFIMDAPAALKTIASADVSLTGEGDWQPAQLEPSRSGYHWQDWTFTWDTPSVGRHTLRARAADAAGNVQPDVPPWNRLGYGDNAIEVIYIDY